MNTLPRRHNTVTYYCLLTGAMDSIKNQLTYAKEYLKIAPL